MRFVRPVSFHSQPTSPPDPVSPPALSGRVETGWYSNGMTALTRSRSLPSVCSSFTRPCCATPPASCPSRHVLPQQATTRFYLSEAEGDELSVSASSPPSCCQAFDSITTNVSAGAEKEAGSCSQVDIRLQDSDCRAGSDEAYAVRRAAGVNASHDPGREEQGAMCVKASPETLDPRQVHKRRQQQLFSLLAASAAAAVTRPDIRSACQSSSNCRRNNMHSSPVVNDDARNPGQNWESSETSPEGSSEDLSEQLYLADDLILRELSEMRQILQKLLEQNKELSLITSPLVADDDILSAVLGLASATAAGSLSRRSSSSSLMTTDSNLSLSPCTVIEASREPNPHFPVGSYDLTECNICFNIKWMYRRACCSFPACADCLTSYYSSRIDLGQVSIECVNSLCRCFVHRDEISLLLPGPKKTTYCTLLANSNSDPLSKTCPRCNHVLKLETMTELKSMERAARKTPTAVQVVCTQCEYCWCFPCASPWHEGISCRQYLKGDRLLQDWAKRVSQGQVNAQKCPKCKILIQKSSGCDHMHCPRCKTDFCYRCGDSLRRLKFFGDHYSKLSVFGCKYRYKAGQPVQRKLIRGAVFASKLMMAPVLGSLALVAGAVVVGVGVAALPLYGGMRLYRKYQYHVIDRHSMPVTSVPPLDPDRSRGLVSTGAQTVRITFLSDNYVDEI